MKELLPGKPVDFGETTLTPLEEKEIRCHVRNGRLWFYASKRPARLLISTPRGEMSFDIPAHFLTNE